jgi:hypothetical protein
MSVEVTSRDQLERVCDAVCRLGIPQLPLFRAAADGLIALVSIEAPTIPWPSLLIEKQLRPICVRIGGDPGVGHPDPSPSAWVCAQRLRYWCRATVVHAAGGELDHYRYAVAATVQFGRLALIETTSGRAREWVQFLKCPRTLVILPRDGVHPVPPKGEDVH